MPNFFGRNFCRMAHGLLRGFYFKWHTVCLCWHPSIGGYAAIPPRGGYDAIPHHRGVYSFPPAWGVFCGGGGGGINIVSTSYIISQFNSQIPHQYIKKNRSTKPLFLLNQPSFSISSLHS
jgi:hypothetical protein